MAAYNGKGGKGQIAYVSKPTTASLNLDHLTGSHRYWRLYIDANNGDPSYNVVEELLLYDANDLDTPATDDGATDVYIASSSNGSSYHESYPFDEPFELLDRYDSSVSRWVSAFEQVDGQWVGVQFAEPKDIVKYILICSGDDFPNIDAAPTAWRLQYSDDGVQWFTRHESGTAWPTEGYNSSNYLDFQHEHIIRVDPPSEETGELTGDAAFPFLTSDSDGFSQNFYEGADQLFEFTQTAQGVASEAVEFPEFTSSAEGVGGKFLYTILPAELPLFESSGFLAGDGLATASAAIPSFDAAATGFQAGDAVGAVFPLFESDATGAVGYSAVGINRLEWFESFGTIFQEGDVTGGVIPPLESVAVGAGGQAGSAFISWPFFGASGTAFQEGDATGIPLFESTATGSNGQIAGGFITWPLFQSTANGFQEGEALGIPTFESTATGTNGTAGTGSASLPFFTSTGETGGGNALEFFTSTATGLQSGSAQGFVVLPFFGSGATGYQEGDATGIPLFESVATGTGGAIGSGFAQLPLFSGSAEGYQEGDATGIPLFESTATGTGGSVSTGYARWPFFASSGISAGEGEATGIPLFESTAEGFIGFAGVSSQQLPLFVSSGTAFQEGDATGIPLFESTATGTTGSVSFGSARLPFFSTNATGSQEGEAIGIPPFVSTATGTGGTVASGSVRWPLFESSGTGYEEGQATGIPLFESTGTGTTGKVGYGQVNWPLFSSASDGYQEGDATGIPLFESEASGFIGAVGSGIGRLPLFGSSGSGYQVGDATGLPLFDSEAEGFVGGVAFGSVSFPFFVSEAGTGGGNTLPLFGSTANALPGINGEGFSVWPLFNSTASSASLGGTLPVFESEAEGLVGSPAYGFNYLLPFESTGTIKSVEGLLDGELAGEADLPSIESQGFVLSENLFSGQAQLLRLVVESEGVTGQVGTAQVIVPIFDSEADGYGENTATATVELPALRVYATGTSSDAESLAVNGVVQGDAIVMNMLNKAITEYQQFGFNSFAHFNGNVIAANSQGIFILRGDKDNNQPIDACVQLGKLDFDSRQLKTIDSIYVGYRSDGDLCLSATTDDKKKHSYGLAPRRLEDRHTARTKLGRGVKGRYWQLEINNVDGSDFEIDTLDPGIRELRRRIR